LEYFDNSANDRELSVLRMTAGGGCEVVKDCIVPDAYSDVKKILASSVKLSPRADSVEDDGIVYSGTVQICVCYIKRSKNAVIEVKITFYTKKTAVIGDIVNINVYCYTGKVKGAVTIGIKFAVLCF